MRSIVAKVDDNGRTQVIILADEETGKFFTKREFLNSIRAIKLAYRQLVREHRVKKMRERLEKEQKDAIISGSNENETRTERETEPRIEAGNSSSRSANPCVERGSSKLERAIKAKRERERREKA